MRLRFVKINMIKSGRKRIYYSYIIYVIYAHKAMTEGYTKCGKQKKMWEEIIKRHVGQ